MKRSNLNSATDAPSLRALASARNTGFTLVELVIVILILGVIGSVTMSRFVGANSLNPLILRDQIISIARSSQQSALGRTNVVLTLTPNAPASEVTLSSSYSGGEIISALAPMTDVTVSGDINTTDSCGTTPGSTSVTNAAPMTLTFSALGNLGVSGVTGSTGAITSGLRICLNDDPAMSICVSPAGFAYAGDCDV